MKRSARSYYAVAVAALLTTLVSILISSIVSADLLSVPVPGRAMVTRTWDGGGATNNWSEGANWTGDVAPGAGDAVLFDGTSTKDAVVDVNFSIFSLGIFPGYSGTVTQGSSNLTIGGLYEQLSGMYVGGNGVISVGSTFAVYGGMFTAPAGTMNLPSTFTVSPGATFNHNGGTIAFTGTAHQDLVVPPSAVFPVNNLVLNKAHDTVLRCNSSGTVTVLGTLTLIDGGMSLNSGGTKIDIQGDLLMSPNFDGATPDGSPITLEISGAATRTVSLPVGARMLPLIVNAPNVTVTTSGIGTFTFSSVDLQSAASFTNGSVHAIFNGPFTLGPTAFTHGTGNASFESSYTQDGGTFTSGSGGLDFKAPFALNSGTFVAPAGPMSFFSHILVLPGTTFNPNGGTAIFTGISAQQFLRFATTLTLNNVTVNRTHDTELFFFNSPTTLVVAGTLQLIDGRLQQNSSASVEARGDVVVGSNFDGGGLITNFRFTGSANQTFTNNGGVNPSATFWRINKAPTSTVTAATNLELTSGQQFIIDSGTLYLAENANLTTSNLFGIAASGKLINESATTITLGGNVTQVGQVDLNGGGASCPGADTIVIRSTNSTQRNWDGGGPLRLIDVDMQNMSRTGSRTVFSGTNSGGNSSAWVFDNGCPAPLTLTPSVVGVRAGTNQIFTAGGGVPPYAFSLAVNNSGGTIGATTGSYTAGSTIGASDTVRVTDAFGGTADAAVTVIGVATRLGFIVQPSNTATGQTITPSVRVAVQDANGNTVTADNRSITISIANNPSAGVLSGTLTREASSGVATFDDLSIAALGSGYTLQATSTGLTTGTSSAFNIAAGSATRLAFTVQPSDVAAQAAISPAVRVAIQDASGNTVTNATGAITIGIGSNPNAGTLSGGLTLNAVNGIAAFSDLTINNVGNGYTLTAASGSLTGATSNAFNILDPFTVINTNDSGAGSLRQAITNANNTPGTQTVSFSIPGTAPFRILVAQLPIITQPLIIDGTTQSGFSGSPVIELSSSAGGGGLVIGGGGTTVRGLVLNGFSTAIVLFGNGGNVIQGNRIGTDVAGNAALPNGRGILVGNDSPNNLIGGSAASERNLISGNNTGIFIQGASGNVVQGNLVGTNAAGTGAIGNVNHGINFFGSGNSIIGNVVSGNGIGIVARGSNALVRQNLIGLDAAGTNQIGNIQQGVLIDTPSVNAVRLTENRISANGGLGIALGHASNSQPLPNDPQDTDTGANNFQNYPVLTAALSSGGTTVILGTLNSAPSSTFTLEFFSSPSCDASGNGEGETFIGSAAVTTDAGGISGLIVSLPVIVPNGRFITATATDPSGNTSGFSRCTIVSTSSQILGRVLNGNGEPIPNVQVQLAVPHAPTLTRTTASNSSGNFSYSFLLPADYALTAIHPNLTFTPATRSYPNLTTDQIDQNFVSGTPQRFTLRGRARTNATGSTVAAGKSGPESIAMPPVPAGGFPLLGITFNVTGPGVNRNVTNDSFGNYRFDSLLPGTYVVTPTKPNYVFNPPVTSITIGGPDQSVDFDGESLGLSQLAGRIVYDSPDGIQAMNADGSGVVRLAGNPRAAAHSSPRLSDNGRRLVVIRRSTTGTEHRIVAIDADGTGSEILHSENAVLSSAVFSPDGTLVAFTNAANGLYVMNSDGSNVQSIESDCTEPDWSPDSIRVVCLDDGGGSTRVKIVDVNTRTQTMLDTSSGRKFSPRWSPDGTKIAFIRSQSGAPPTRSVVIKTLLGGTNTFMSGTNNLFQSLSWSPDGARLLFMRDSVARTGRARPPGGNKQLVTIQSSDGQNMLVIVDGFDGMRVDWGTSNSVSTPPSPTPTTISSGAVSISFPSITGANGVTTITPIEPNSAGAAPNGFMIGNFAFEISTTANYTPPVTICIDLDTPGVQSRLLPAELPAMMHNENGVLVNITTSYDQTTRILCGQANSFSPFVVAEQIDASLSSITGLVIDSNGDPMSGIALDLTGAETGHTRTDSNGLFRFVNLASGGNYNVQPRSVGYLFNEYSQDFLAVTGETTVVFTGTATEYQIAGRVVNFGGTGVSGVRITLDGAASEEVLTDATGNYLFTGVPADGSYFVSPSGAGFSFTPGQHSVSALTSNIAGMDFTAFAPTAASVSVGGRVVTSEGQGIGKARVSIADTNGNIRNTLTNPFGYYRFDDVEVGGIYVVSVEARQHQFENPTRTINVVDELTDVDFIALSP